MKFKEFIKRLYILKLILKENDDYSYSQAFFWSVAFVLEKRTNSECKLFFLIYGRH